MSSELTQIERRMLRVYELGRLKWAARVAGVLLLLTATGLLIAGRSMEFYGIGAVLALTSGVYMWRGGDLGNALMPGLAVSMVPLVLSATLLDCTAECSGFCMQHCMTVCATGAAVAGILAAVLMRKHPRKHRAWLFAVALVPACGLLGCPHIGYGQLVGLILGLAVARLFLGMTDRYNQSGSG